nr:hypothetical transcript [Hymenolepis microstoma]
MPIHFLHPDRSTLGIIWSQTDVPWSSLTVHIRKISYLIRSNLHLKGLRNVTSPRLLYPAKNLITLHMGATSQNSPFSVYSLSFQGENGFNEDLPESTNLETQEIQQSHRLDRYSGRFRRPQLDLSWNQRSNLWMSSF